MLHKLEVPFQILERSMDRLESMSTLLTAVEAGSLSAAARQLAIPLSTVSRRISELEAHLKARLLNRSSRKLTLTYAGRSYVEACKRILEEVGEAERAASGEYSAAKGGLNITAPMVFGRLHVLPSLWGHARALIPSYRRGESRRLNIVLEEVEPLPSPVSLVYSGQRRLPLKLRAFPRFRRDATESTTAEGGHVSSRARCGHDAHCSVSRKCFCRSRNPGCVRIEEWI